jgi:DNA-binding NtrC family response regulator
LKDVKVLIAGCSNPIISSNIQRALKDINCKVNIIGDLKNILVSVALDKPDIVCIHFHPFTHNALEISKELNNKYEIPSIFFIDSDSFRDAVEICDFNILGCLNIPFIEKELIDIIKTYKNN